MHQSSNQLYIGLMSGTSLDAVDAVLVDFAEHGMKLVARHEHVLPDTIKEVIRQLNFPSDNELERSQILDKQLGQLFADASLALLRKCQIQSHHVRAIGCHGQTLRHAPDGEHGFSLQVGDANLIAELTGITTINDFRSRDVAAGGQGAPLVPAFHLAKFHRPDSFNAVVNIGGMANVSLIKPDSSICGFDTGPGNVLMDGWCLKNTGNKYDKDGAWADSGTINKQLLDGLLDHPFFKRAPPKSTGREAFDLHWLDSFELDMLKPEDVQATLLELTALSICQALPNEVNTIYLCGGGAHNLKLKQRIFDVSGKKVQSTSELGLDPDWVEATAFAWLAYRCLNGQPGNCPTATGARGPRILGAIHQA